MNSGQAASGSSIASIGLSTYATLLKAQGTATADSYQADRLEKAAEYGDVKAIQTGGQMTRNLNTVLGNIDAVRAAANTDPSSPTGAVIHDYQESRGEEQRDITVGNIKAQSDQARSDAAYYRQASADALLSGKISAAAGIFAGVARAGAAFATGGASEVAATGLSLTGTGGLY